MEFSRLTLKFKGKDSILEEKFLDNYFQNSLSITRIALFLGAVFYAAFGILDAILLPEVKHATWFIRYALVCPLILFWFFFSFHSKYRKYWQASFVSIILAAGLGIIHMIIIAPEPANYTYYAGLILVLIYCYTFFRTRFIWASLTCWGLVGLYEIVAIFLLKIPLHILVNNNFFFISTGLLGMFACYSVEYYARKTFYFQYLLENQKLKVAEINEELERKVVELRQALAEIKTLSGLLPICARCKKIRDDKGYWNQIEEYIKQHSEAEFSHGLCPECAEELYSKFMDSRPKR